MNKLKQLIKSKGTKQSWLADQLGVTTVTVSNWCRGETMPTKGMKIAIAKVLNVELNELEE